MYKWGVNIYQTFIKHLNLNLCKPTLLAVCTCAEPLIASQPCTLSAATFNKVFLHTYVFVPSGRLRRKSVMVFTYMNTVLSSHVGH